MITITANARRATFKSDDLVTSGSVGIPVEFILSDDFDGLSSIAVFEGSGASVDVALMSDTCVVPPEVVATPGGYLRIGVYARNGEGTIVIPTVWVSTQVILPGAEPSGVDPSQPTPDWTAQVQEAAAEALEIAHRVENMGATAETLPAGSEATVEKAVDPDTGAVTLSFGIPRGDRGEQGPQGEPGERGETGSPGPAGEDGISPAITVTDITGGHRVTITDATGPHSFDVLNGETGADGFSPIARVEQTATGATVTITDKDGTTIAEISNGQTGHQGEIGPQGNPGEGVAPGGTTGQMLVKKTDADYDTEWVNPPQTVEIDSTLTVSGAAADAKATGDAILDLYPVATAGPSAIVSVDDAAPLEAEGLVAQIEPVQAGSGDPSPDNVRPISGWTGAKLTQCGKNLFDKADTAKQIVNGYFAGNLPITEGSGRMVVWVPCKPNTTYTIHRDRAEGESETRLAVGTTEESPAFGVLVGQYVGNTMLSYTITTSATAKYLVVWAYWGGTTQALDSLVIELGSTATDYEPYQGDIYDITFPSTAGTVYGGKLDVTTGLLTVTMAEVDLGTLNWKVSVGGSNTAYTVGAALPALYDSASPKWLCTAYKSVTYSTASSLSDMYVWIDPTHRVRVKDTSKNELTDATFKSAMSGVQLVYELATPQTYQLTPTEIQLLLGDNNVWADTGDMTLTYRQDVAILLSKLTAQVAALNSAVTNS